MKQENTKSGIPSLLLIGLLLFSSFMTFFFIFEFTDNYKIIKHAKQFKKIKVKIDSTKTSSSRSGKSSATSASTTFYFNKGSILTNQDRKGIILNHQSYEQEIYEYMTDHQDSLYIWKLDDKTSKFAYEDQKNINVSEEIENNNKIKIYFVVYIFFLVLFLKFRNRI